jgi:hypothetical protein
MKPQPASSRPSGTMQRLLPAATARNRRPPGAVIPEVIGIGLGETVNEPDGTVQAPDEIAEADRVRRAGAAPYPSSRTRSFTPDRASGRLASVCTIKRCPLPCPSPRTLAGRAMGTNDATPHSADGGCGAPSCHSGGTIRTTARGWFLTTRVSI